MPLPELLVDMSEFFEAVIEGDTDAVRRFLEGGANPNEAGPIERGVFLEALLLDNTEIACLLLSYGAHPDGISDIPPTPLSIAVGNQDIFSIRALLGHGADINAGVGADGSGLHTAVQRGNVEIVQMLLDKGIDLALTDEDGEDVLTYARLCWNYWKTEQRAEIVKILERA